jgi:hypothetical protein
MQPHLLSAKRIMGGALIFHFASPQTGFTIQLSLVLFLEIEDDSTRLCMYTALESPYNPAANV